METSAATIKIKNIIVCLFNFPMNLHVRHLFGWSVDRSVCHNFQGRKITLHDPIETLATLNLSLPS